MFSFLQVLDAMLSTCPAHLARQEVHVAGLDLAVQLDSCVVEES